MAIAEHVAGLLADAGLDVRPRAALPATAADAEPRRGGHPPLPGRRPHRGDPAYGAIVCFCERVTAGEIRDAYRSALPPVDLEGLRRRTRAMNGRCQGFYCGATVAACVERRGGPAEVVERG